MNTEVLVIQFLKDNIDSSWSVSGEVPESLPAKFITVERSGGGGREAMVLDMAEIQINCYSKNSKLEAALMADEVADLMPAMLKDYEDITRAKVNSVIQFDDLTRGYRRYSVYTDVFYRR